MVNRVSSYEQKVIDILHKEKIFFVKEKTFKDLRYGLYRYDFYIPNKNILIEVNGEQHYYFTKRFHSKRTDFTKAQERDRAKIGYALGNSIPLYIIPYWDINNLSTFSDIIDSKFLATSKFHNDEVYRKYLKN